MADADADDEYVTATASDDTDGDEYVERIERRLEHDLSLPDDVLATAEEYGVREDVELAIGEQYVAEMRKGSKDLFRAEMYQRMLDDDLEHTQQMSEYRIEYDVDVADPQLPESYQETREAYQSAEQHFQRADRLRSYLSDEVLDDAKQVNRLLPVMRPKYPIQEEEAEGPAQMMKTGYLLLRGVKDLVSGDLLRRAYLDNPDQHREEAEQGLQDLEDRVAPVREQLEREHQQTAVNTDEEDMDDAETAEA